MVQLSPAEGNYIAEIFNDAGNSKWDAMWVDGIHIAGDRYVVFKEDERKTIFGRKVSFILDVLSQVDRYSVSNLPQLTSCLVQPDC